MIIISWLWLILLLNLEKLLDKPLVSPVQYSESAHQFSPLLWASISCLFFCNYRLIRDVPEAWSAKTAYWIALFSRVCKKFDNKQTIKTRASNWWLLSSIVSWHYLPGISTCPLSYYSLSCPPSNQNFATSHRCGVNGIHCRRQNEKHGSVRWTYGLKYIHTKLDWHCT